jgi:hypothetical protein
MGAKYRRTTGSRRPLGLSAFYSLNDTQWRRDDELELGSTSQSCFHKIVDCYRPLWNLCCRSR